VRQAPYSAARKISVAEARGRESLNDGRQPSLPRKTVGFQQLQASSLTLHRALGSDLSDVTSQAPSRLILGLERGVAGSVMVAAEKAPKIKASRWHLQNLRRCKKIMTSVTLSQTVFQARRSGSLPLFLCMPLLSSARRQCAVDQEKNIQ
jgi:hypothetical protein